MLMTDLEDFLRLQPRLDRIKGILHSISIRPAPYLLSDIPRQTSRADYSSSQRPRFCSASSISSPARSAAPLAILRSDPWAGSEYFGYWAAHPHAVAYWLSLAAEDCERLPTALAMGPVAGQAPSRPRLRHHSEGVGCSVRDVYRKGCGEVFVGGVWDASIAGCWRLGVYALVMEWWG
jgi:hypothetical protein